MKITKALIEKGSTQKRIKAESQETFLRRITHVSLYDKAIEQMENLHFCKNLTTLYLNENNIRTISGLECCRSLARLYLQNNCIEEITGLDVGLDVLHTLYLHNNCINRFSGLHALPSLVHLKLDNQKIPDDVAFEFDEESVDALATSLEQLSLAHAGVQEVALLSRLRRLERLDLTGNAVYSVDELEFVVSSCLRLSTLDVGENPIMKDNPAKVRQRLMLASPALACLNGKDIPDVERTFAKNMLQAKEARLAYESRRASLDPASQPSDAKEKLRVAGDQGNVDKPIPHLPPYASQYRDLILEQLAKATEADSLPMFKRKQSKHFL
ncbi:hypothetical protein BC832DRAFT_588811 [Gaertneriomyces semiglobifer]|nr:hypothetical protein BC832DRAFT_588811 [Gaertneriomyces semiglobifer]